MLRKMHSRKPITWHLDKPMDGFALAFVDDSFTDFQK
jgi:hypothetical protein